MWWKSARFPPDFLPESCMASFLHGVWLPARIPMDTDTSSHFHGGRCSFRNGASKRAGSWLSEAWRGGAQTRRWSNSKTRQHSPSSRARCDSHRTRARAGTSCLALPPRVRPPPRARRKYFSLSLHPPLPPHVAKTNLPRLCVKNATQRAGKECDLPVSTLRENMIRSMVQILVATRLGFDFKR